jgi:structural maintenance of chromosome 4
MYRRLMISKIELENFKSYCGRKVIGPLHKNFTAVVGPNGSGKSNCIESLLFVFGKRAKQMRLNKLSELIHKSAQHGDCQTASVRVFFTDIIDQEDDPDAYTEVEGSQFTVSRVVNRASTSKYFINNNAVDYKDVCDLLQTKGIDLEHNRFLILQGEVE